MYILAFSNQFVLIEVNFAFPPAMNISACPPAPNTRHSAPPTMDRQSRCPFLCLLFITPKAKADC